jgi:flagellar hook assembly protein FlgD
VVTLVSEKQMAGHHQIEWDGSDFASGVYLYKMETGNGFRQTRKLVLLK